MNKQDNDRNDFWLDLGPAADWAGMDAQQRAELEGDASPDGKRRGFYGAELGTVYRPTNSLRDDLDPRTAPEMSGTLPGDFPVVPPEYWPAP